MMTSDRPPGSRRALAMRSHAGLVYFVCIGLALAIGCAGPEGPEQAATRQRAETPTTPESPPARGWTRLDTHELAPAHRALAARAVAARKEMAVRLRQELIAAIDSDGPPAAIEVCANAAPAIAAQVAAAHEVRIGRTSHRLRNSENRPPAWSEPFLDGETTRDEPIEQILVALPDDGLGALTPIRLHPECEICHGPSEAIAEEVRARIAEHYPEDRATGFVAGDLRGWFWVEVPKGRASDGA